MADNKNIKDGSGDLFVLALKDLSGIFHPKHIYIGNEYNANVSGVDAVTESLLVLQHDHHEIHSGNSFVCDEIVNVNNTSQTWMVTTPDSTAYAHMLFSIDCTGEIQVVVTEGADRSGTTPLAAINRRRVGSPASATVAVHRGTSGGTTDGVTTILAQRSGSTNVGGRTVLGGGTRGENEYILKANTKYVITVTTYANVYVNFHINWYEHIDLN